MDDHAAQPPRQVSSERGTDGGSLKTARLQEKQEEEEEHVNTDLPTVSLSQLAGSQATSNNGRNVVRPKTAPSARSGITDERRSFLEDEVKRDSGFAATSANAPSESNNDAASPARGLAHTPSLPTIVVHDADSHRLPTLERIISPFTKKRHQGTASEPQRPATAHQRIKSFHGIETDIPTGEFGDLALGNIDFSTRGSLMFSGKKMSELIAAQGPLPVEDVTPKSPTLQEGDDDEAEFKTPPQSPVPHIETSTEDATTIESPKPAGPESEPKKRSGLVSGRRQPSVHMLQAAIAGGRVLSAEEITFSMRVRSMYEHGNESAADWTTPYGGASRTASPEPTSTTPELPSSLEGIVMDRTRDTNGLYVGQNPDEVRASYTKEPHEVAGGMEDWADLKGADVDRFGFINPSLLSSKEPGMPRMSGTMGLQRVATGLRLVSDQPRRERSRLRRNVSISRSARSAPPGKDSSAGSVRSFQSNRSGSVRRGRFRSSDRRAMDEASNMLTLPPGLADIAEHQAPGKTLDLSQRKEWSRNEKWLQMARKRSDSKGAGMSFDFDTSNSKVISRTWKGIPDRWRAAAWHSFLSASARRRGDHVSDEELIENFHRLQELNCADDVQIDVDVPRTISMHIMFRKRYRGGQRLLFRVLHAIALYCPDTGYVQGMASLAATLLCYFDEERAFVMLVRLWQLRGLEQLFRTGFDGLMAALQDFEDQWLRGGDVANRLEALGISSTAYGTRWYLTLFNMSVPFPAQLRVWDVFMLLGDLPAGAPAAAREAFGGADLDVLHATSAALIDATREIILETDFEGAMKTLTSFVPVRDEDMLMRVAKAEYKMRKKRGL
ncbi:hypothetical protein Q7P35_007893 [Cladosporium inversicolor]